MEQGGAAGRFHLLAEDGGELIGALLPMPPELWDRPRRRLTVLLEPGRIKRGIATERPGRAAARARHLGHLRGGRPTHRCCGCAVGERRAAHVSNRRAHSLARGPQVGGTCSWPDSAGDQLVVRFGRSLDRALVRRCLKVVGPDGRVVPGQAVLDRDAAIWTFTPAIGLCRRLESARPPRSRGPGRQFRSAPFRP